MRMEFPYEYTRMANIRVWPTYAYQAEQRQVILSTVLI